MRFKMHCSQEPIPELTKEGWLDRCSYPIDLNPSGVLFSPDSMPAETFWLVADINFRRFMGTIVFLAKGPNDNGKWLDVVPKHIDSSRIFAWPYIDQECGLTFRYLCPAVIDEDKWITFERDESALVTFRLSALENAIWCPTDLDPIISKS